MSKRSFKVWRGDGKGGGGVPGGRKSLNFTITLASDERTLTREDEEEFLRKVRAGVASIGAELRG